MKIKSLLLTTFVAISILSCEKEPDTQYSLSVSPTSLQFQASGNTEQTLTVTSGEMEWSASVEESGKDWIDIKYDRTSVTVNVKDNGSMEPRQGSVLIVPSISEVMPVSITVSQAAKEAPDAEQLSQEGLITYYAQDFLFSTNGNDEWLLNFFTADSDYELRWENFGKDGYWNYNINNGRVISLYLYTVPSDDFFNPDITDGTYTARYEVGTMESMTFLTSDYFLGLPWPQGSFITEYKSGSQDPSYIDIVDGEVTVEHNGKEYHVYMVLTLGDESKVAYEFSGNMELSILGIPPYYSDLTEDLNIESEEIAQSAITASYANLNNPDLNEWIIEFLGEGLTVDGTGAVSGNGYMIGTHLFAPNSENGTIPEGEYTINVADAYSDIDAFSAMIGAYNPLMGNSGCYIDIHDGDNLNFAPMSEGTIKVTCIDKDNYRFEFNAMDDNGHKITITYEGYVTKADSQI